MTSVRSSELPASLHGLAADVVAGLVVDVVEGGYLEVQARTRAWGLMRSNTVMSTITRGRPRW